MQTGATQGSDGLGAGLSVIEQAESSTPSPPEERRAPVARPNPAEVLAQLMDFPGGMKVAEQLEADAPTRPRHPEADELGRRLERDVEARLGALKRNAMAPLLGVRGPKMPSAEELADAFRAAGLEAGRDEAAFAKFSEMTGSPLRAAVSASMRQSQIQIGTLRWEIVDDLRRLGPDAERIEKLDGALHTATQAAVRELFERVELSLRETWGAACQRALGELPEEPSVADFEAWLRPDGWLERFRDRCIRASQAVYEHLRRNLSGLVRAAVSAEES